jgi:hypothetical protein
MGPWKKKNQQTGVLLYQIISFEPYYTYQNTIKRIKTLYINYIIESFWTIVSYYITPHEISYYIKCINPIISIIFISFN